MSLLTSGHNGLMMTSEFDKALQSELVVGSSPKKGTRLNFRIPLAHVKTNPGSDQTTPIMLLIDPSL